MLRTWALKVDRLASIDCSSPTSAKTSSKTTTVLPVSTGTGTPDCAITDNSPMVFRRTVLPPVFGPETSSVRSSRREREVERHHRDPLCDEQRMPRPAQLHALGRFCKRGRGTPEVRREARPGIERVELGERARGVLERAGEGAQPVGQLEQQPSTSRSSSASSSRMRLQASTAAGGSTNSVAPLPEVSCTMPPTTPRASRRTGIT